MARTGNVRGSRTAAAGHSIRYTMLRLAPVLVLAAGIPLSTTAQVVRGRLLEMDGATGLGGAMMTLVLANGTQVGGALTGSDGAFEITAPAAGRYRLRAERIGYATTYSAHFDVQRGGAVRVDVSAPVEAISLEGIKADGERSCGVGPREGLALARVWDEARKALAAAAWTRESGYYRYEVRTLEQRIDPKSSKVLAEDRSYNRTYARAPYVSRPADSLLEGGFARITSKESVYWAPDAEVLLSDAFLRTHCFSLRTDRERTAGLIGLRFEPRPGRTESDIAGTLWIDPRTSRLERLDYAYRNLNHPRATGTGNPGGTLDFEALPNGTWIVRSWRIRMPRWGRSTSTLTGKPAAFVEEIVVQGGDVMRVHGNEGKVLEVEPGPGVTGVVVDSLRVGLPGARVFAEGTGIESVTDAEGRFTLAGLEPGLYSIGFTHPYLEPFAYTAESLKVRVLARAKTPAQVGLHAPAVATIVRRMCRDAETPVRQAPGGRRPPAGGILVGRVTDRAGEPLPDATVRVLSTRYHIASSGEGVNLSSGHTGVLVTTDASGYYRACRVPVDMPLKVAVVEAGDASSAEDPGGAVLRTSEHEVVIDPRESLGRMDLRINAGGSSR